MDCHRKYKASYHCICALCAKEFVIQKHRIKNVENNQVFFCTKKCADEAKKPKFNDIIKIFEQKDCVLISKEYVRAKEKLEFICNKHEECGVQKITYSNFKKGLGCRYCGFEINSSKQNKNDIAKIKKAFEAKGLTLIEQEYIHAHQLLKYICNKHKEEGIQAMSYSNVKNNGCPRCNQSKGERDIAIWLSKNNIIFVPQKKFTDLVGLSGKCLSYDFYLPNNNCLIEYQGEFHDGTSSLQTIKGYQKQKVHDERKRQYAIDNNIELIEICTMKKRI